MRQYYQKFITSTTDDLSQPPSQYINARFHIAKMSLLHSKCCECNMSHFQTQLQCTDLQLCLEYESRLHLLLTLPPHFQEVYPIFYPEKGQTTEEKAGNIIIFTIGTYSTYYEYSTSHTMLYFLEQMPPCTIRRTEQNNISLRYFSIQGQSNVHKQLYQ